MDPAINLPGMLLNILASVEAESFLQCWRVYSENGKTNIVLKYLPKMDNENVSLLNSSSKNSTNLSNSKITSSMDKTVLRHKSPAKQNRGNQRVAGFINSCKQKQQHSSHEYLSIDSINQDHHVSSSVTTETNSCEPDLMCASEDSDNASYTSTCSLDTLLPSINRKPSVDISCSDIITVENCSSSSDKVVNVAPSASPTISCDYQPQFGDTVTLDTKSAYIETRKYFHNSPNLSDQSDLLRYANWCKIDDDCPHLRQPISNLLERIT